MMVNNVSQNKIKEYISIVEKVAKVEHRRIPSHMVDYEELVSIGIIAVQAMIKNKTPEQLEKYNSSYIGTAVRWAIRNELRNRYKWYTIKHNKTDGWSWTTENFFVLSVGLYIASVFVFSYSIELNYISQICFTVLS